ncbi:hypothetical protein DOTSEDRAFT_19115 [Dothistroma septosporum NZE10]|uniref:Uncharacterized protein n=1 Tax=Dothistroma septosporum (strain NZE10 / CBS 128990) TaxID=675120 RepID=N1PYK6_DOTSN|nr:hypothetical protein DOTSEDRAFT_19115 [Dothistroma septosporum NZE10]
MADKGAEQHFNFETMAVVLYCVLESGVVLGEKHYQMMAAVDGNRSASAFQHQFRKVKARAKELQEQGGGGGGVTAGTPLKKTKSAASTPASKGKKRGKKTGHDEEVGGAQGDEERKAKRVKAEPSDDEL